MIMKPKHSPYPLIRVGGNCDGAYLIPNCMEGISACFSPGVNNTKDFEDELVERYGIPCHMCDFTSDINAFRTPIIEGMQTFKKKWLDVDGDDDSISLDEWVNELSPSVHNDLLLQMDIEGAEYKNLLECSDETLKRFRVILVELHDLDIANTSRFDDKLEPLLRRLDKYFICVHAHPNNCCGEFILEGTSLAVPRVIELTFLRRNCFYQDPDGCKYAPQLPHPLDITYNVRELPPLFLEGDWLCNVNRPPDSMLTKLSSKLDYSLYKIEQLDKEASAHGRWKAEAEKQIAYLENRFAELKQPINSYLIIKKFIKNSCLFNLRMSRRR